MSEQAMQREAEIQPNDPSMDATGDATAYDRVRGTPFTLDDVDDDILADFAAVGITVRGVPHLTEHLEFSARAEALTVDAADRTAMAGVFLRRAIECDAEVEQLKAAMMKQVELVTAHYERLMTAPARRRDTFLHLVENIARLAADLGDFGKKKSASTPWGDFGVQDRKATLQVTDSAALIAYLRETAPQFVRVVAKLPLDQAREYLSPTELEATKMDVAWGEYKKTIDPDFPVPPPGVEQVPAARIAFAKPMAPLTSN